MQIISSYHKLDDMYSSKSTFVEEFFTSCEVNIIDGGTALITDVPTIGIIEIKTVEQLNDFRKDFESRKI